MSPAILSAKSPEELQKSEKVSFERSGLLLVPRTLNAGVWMLLA